MALLKHPEASTLGLVLTHDHIDRAVALGASGRADAQARAGRESETFLRYPANVLCAVIMSGMGKPWVLGTGLPARRLSLGIEGDKPDTGESLGYLP